MPPLTLAPENGLLVRLWASASVAVMANAAMARTPMSNRAANHSILLLLGCWWLPPRYARSATRCATPWPSGSRTSTRTPRPRSAAGSVIADGETSENSRSPDQVESPRRIAAPISVVCQCAMSFALQIGRRRPAVARREVLEQLDARALGGAQAP